MKCPIKIIKQPKMNNLGITLPLYQIFNKDES